MDTRELYRTLRGAIAVALAVAACSDHTELPLAEAVDPPPGPVLFRVASTDSIGIGLAWAESGSSVDEFRIERRQPDSRDFQPVGAVPVGDTSFRDTLVSPGNLYNYRVLAVKGGVSSVPSELVWAVAAPSAPPSRPTLRHPAADAMEVPASTDLAWERDEGSDVSFDVYLAAPGEHLRRIVVDSFESSVNVTDLAPGSLHRWLIVAHSPTGTSALSSEWSFMVQPERFVVFEGYFIMGDESNVVHPRNPVRTERFSIDRFEVSNELYAGFLNAADSYLVRAGVVEDPENGLGLIGLGPENPGSRIRFEPSASRFEVEPGWEKHPVVNVSWFGADEYASFVGRKLPTEKQWEKAARGVRPELGDTIIVVIENGDTLTLELGLGYPYPWGAGIDSRYANYGNSGDPYEDSGLAPQTTPIGFYDGREHHGFETIDNASPYGASDMAGNVAEWIFDWSGPYQNPHSPPGRGESKVVRGGSWVDTPDRCRTFVRSAVQPEQMVPWLGFRTVGPP